MPTGFKAGVLSLPLGPNVPRRGPHSGQTHTHLKCSVLRWARPSFRLARAGTGRGPRPGGEEALCRGSREGARVVHSETHTNNTSAGELERQAEDKWKILEYN